jgi:hypothetical protein
MVNVGFICEGETERILVTSTKFKELLIAKNISLINVIDAKGRDNLRPHNIEQHLHALEADGAEKIIIVTDLDDDACITVTKQRINARVQDIVVIAVKQVEAWFLACTPVMQVLLKDTEFVFDSPEEEPKPFETIRTLMLAKTGRGVYKGVGGKIKLAHILRLLGFDISQAASHPNCPSAAYFIKKLDELGLNVSPEVLSHE